MTEGGNGRGAPQVAPLVQLVITLDPETRQVKVTGPLGDRMACYAMLEMAREIVQAAGRQPERSRLVQPPPGLRFG